MRTRLPVIAGVGALSLLAAWVPGMGRAVTEFNKTHPGICVTQEDVGAGDPDTPESP
jgi:hypothetical protein